MLLKSHIIEGLEVAISFSNKEIIDKHSFVMVVGGVGRDKAVVGRGVNVDEKV